MRPLLVVGLLPLPLPCLPACFPMMYISPESASSTWQYWPVVAAFSHLVSYSPLPKLKFGYSEKATKIWNNLPLDLSFTKQTSKHVGDCSKFCGLLRKPELYMSRSQYSEVFRTFDYLVILTAWCLAMTCSIKLCVIKQPKCHTLNN